MKSIAIYNHKGGVGKTSFTAAIAGELMLMKKKVLMIDADSQANLTNQFLVSKDLDREFADYLFADKTTQPEILQKVIKKTEYPNLFIMPTKKPSSEGGRLVSWTSTEASNIVNQKVITKLLVYLAQIGFDYVLFDMPPSDGNFDKMILSACDEILPVLKIEKDSIEGLKDFYIGVNELREIRDEDQKPIVNKLVFNMRNKTQKTQNDLIPGIEALPSDKYIFPQESAIEVAKREKCLIQEYKIKKETKELLKALTEKLMEN